MYTFYIFIYILANGAPDGAVESAAFGGVKRKHKFGAPAAPQISGAFVAPNGFKNFRWAMRRIPNMGFILKLDNGKVVSIAEEQIDRITEPPSTVLVYRYIYTSIYTRINIFKCTPSIYIY